VGKAQEWENKGLESWELRPPKKGWGPNKAPTPKPQEMPNVA